ncbi:MAG: hypothetical protein LBC86_09035, partial [Oscillospiraceae bacterium]|nr:hypothetical protein [Oscillospiraceae bacterium]
IESDFVHFRQGQIVRAVFVHGKSNLENITGTLDLDRMIMRVYDTSTFPWRRVAHTPLANNLQNVHIIEFTIPRTGFYVFEADAISVIDESRGVPITMMWRVI